MAKTVTKTKATTWLRILAGSAKKQKEVGFACGRLDNRAFFIVTKGSPETAISLAKQYEWKKDEKDKDKSKKIKTGVFVLRANGSAMIDEGGALTVKFKKQANARTIHAFGKEFWKDTFKIPPIWTGVKISGEEIDEADFIEDVENADEILDDLPTEEEIAALGAERLETPLEFVELPNVLDPEDEDFDLFGPDDGDAKKDDDYVEVKDEDTELGEPYVEVKNPSEEKKLAPDTEKRLKAELAVFVDVFQRSNQSIGVKNTAEASALLDKFFDWIADLVAGLPPDQQLAAALNWVGRLMLAAASIESRRMLQAVKPGKKADQATASGEAAGDELTNEMMEEAKKDENEIEKERVIRILFDKAKAMVVQRDLAYEVGMASSVNVERTVDSGWARAVGPDLYKTVADLLGGVERICTTDKGLIKYLVLDGHKKIDPAAMAPLGSVSEADVGLAAQEDSSLIEPRIADLKYNYAQVAKTVDDLIAEAETALFDAMEMNVKDLGGSWDEVRQYIAGLQIAVAEAALQKVVGTTGEERRKAALDAKAVLDQQQSLLTHRLTDLLDASPFSAKPEIQGLLGGCYAEAKVDLAKLSVMQQAA
jgi:hypothetical protein